MRENNKNKKDKLIKLMLTKFKNKPNRKMEKLTNLKNNYKLQAMINKKKVFKKKHNKTITTQ